MGAVYTSTLQAATIYESDPFDDGYQVRLLPPPAPRRFPSVDEIATPGVTYGVTTDDCSIDALSRLAVARATGQYEGVQR